MRIVRALGVIFWVFAASSEAALTLLVNPSPQTLTLVGTDSGITDTNNGLNPEGEPIQIGQVRWELTGLGGPALGTSGNFQNGELMTVGPAILMSANMFSNDGSDGTGGIMFRIFVDAPGLLSVTGTESPQLFTVATPELFARFVAADGQSMAPVAGTGFSPIQVVVVPEPSTLLLALGGCALILRRNRATSGRSRSR